MQYFRREVLLKYDALLLVSFGGPEGIDDVIPFLERVLKNRKVPRARMLEVAEHYYHFKGISPINEQNRALIRALEQELTKRNLELPIYWGNRNWHPLLGDTINQMARDGIKKVLAFVTSGYSSYSNCRQYLENIEEALVETGNENLVIDKIRPFFHHPGFLETMVSRVNTALHQIPEENLNQTHFLYTAHSIPESMAQGCAYKAQLEDISRLISQNVGATKWALTFQSRSGSPSQAWLGPDVIDYIKMIHANQSIQNIVIIPVGFVSDHMEVVYELDVEVRSCCEELDIHMVRVETAGTHPRFVEMVVELIQERQSNSIERPSVGELAPCPDYCSIDFCSSVR